MATAEQQLKALDPEIQAFLSAIVEAGREALPGLEGLARFHKGLQVLERIISETLEEAGH